MSISPPAILALSLVLVACQKPVPTPASSPARVDEPAARARRAVEQLRASLQKALGQALVRDRSSAIEVCARRAPALATEIAAQSGVSVGRTSHRLRNAANAPRPWVQALLAEYRGKPAGATPRVVSLPGGVTGYVEPIYTRGMCLSCHGSTIDPIFAARIRETYPQDQATGFKEGELRGLFWAEAR